MKPEEAIKRIDKALSYNPGMTDKDWEAFHVMEDATEKRIAKKPRYYIDNWGHNRPGCPGCPRNEILYAGQKYCSVCGTKIDWEETP